MRLTNRLFCQIQEAATRKKIPKSIGLLRRGCSNRPFFIIGVVERFKGQEDDPIEQIGNYDPMPNQFNEKLVAIDFERLEYWIKQEVYPTVPVAKLLGLCGYFPIHPDLFQDAWRNRFKINERLNQLRKEVETLQAASKQSPKMSEPSSQEPASPDSSNPSSQENSSSESPKPS